MQQVYHIVAINLRSAASASTLADNTILNTFGGTTMWLLCQGSLVKQILTISTKNYACEIS